MGHRRDAQGHAGATVMAGLVALGIVVGGLALLTLRGESPESSTETPAPVVALSTSPVDEPLRAFPGAEGFGAFTTGGRGGRVLHVTSLADRGPGTLRAALEAVGPRTVVFDIAGTITLESVLRVTSSDVTIAGQTAPAPGITVRGKTLDLTAGNIIVRYLRLRRGDADRKKEDALVARGPNLILDHCSFSWGTDENVDLWAETDLVTIQWSVFSENFGSGALRAGYETPGPVRYSFHHNAFAHFPARAPRIARASSMLVDWRNNVVYDWVGNSFIGNQRVPAAVIRLNAVNNFYQYGPSTKPAVAQRAMFRIETVRPPELFISGNIMNGRTADQASFVKGFTFVNAEHDIPSQYRVTTTAAQAAYDAVLAHAGATVPARDPVDERIIAEIRNRSGTAIGSQTEVGGWPDLRAERRPTGFDTDGDGMPDTWERAQGLNPRAEDNNGDADGDGYTNLEEYLNGLVADTFPGAGTPR